LTFKSSIFNILACAKLTYASKEWTYQNMDGEGYPLRPWKRRQAEHHSPITFHFR
jgi:hypothetical protein